MVLFLFFLLGISKNYLRPASGKGLGRPRQRKVRPAVAAFDLQSRMKSLDAVATRVITGTSHWTVLLFLHRWLASLRGIGWTHMKKKYKYKLALFEVRVGRAPCEVSAPFQVSELFSTSSWRSFQVQVGGLFEVSAPFQEGRTVRLSAHLSSSSQPTFSSQRTFSRGRRTRNS